MLALSQSQLNSDIGTIQVLHARLGLDLANCMAYHTGNFMFIAALNRRNITIGNYLDILTSYTVVGDEVITENYNVLTISDVQSIIDDCYREMNKYNTVP